MCFRLFFRLAFFIVLQLSLALHFLRLRHRLQIYFELLLQMESDACMLCSSTTYCAFDFRETGCNKNNSCMFACHIQWNHMCYIHHDFRKHNDIWLTNYPYGEVNI